MESGLVLTDRRDRVGVITLNRPEVRNAINTPLRKELEQALQDMARDAAIHVIVMTGAGGAFSAGADIREQVRREEEPSSQRPLDRTSDRANVAVQVARCPKPVIAAVNGVAVGFGSLLATAADLRFGCERSQFRFPGAVYGRINATWTLAMIVGASRAKDLLWSGRTVEAEEAKAMGLLDRLFLGERLMDETLAYARGVAEHAPEMMQAVKRLLNGHVGLGMEEMYRAEQEAYRDLQIPPAREVFKDFLRRS